MNPVDQTIFTVPGGNCLQACLASVFEVPLESVPHFADLNTDDWWAQCQDWCTRFGVYPAYIPADGVAEPKALLRGYHLILVTTPKRHSHIVVGRNGEAVHDPVPGGAGVARVDGYVMFVSTMEDR